MQQICDKYATNMQQISNTYATNVQQICTQICTRSRTVALDARRAFLEPGQRQDQPGLLLHRQEGRLCQEGRGSVYVTASRQTVGVSVQCHSHVWGGVRVLWRLSLRAYPTFYTLHYLTLPNPYKRTRRRRRQCHSHGWVGVGVLLG